MLTPSTQNKIIQEQALLIKKWAKRIAGLRLMHMESSAYYRRQNSLIQYSIIVLSPVLAITTFVNVDNVAVNYVTGAFNLVIGAITAMNRWLRPSEQSEIHANLAKSYETLYRKIQFELSLVDEEKESIAGLMDKVREEMDKLADMSPHFPEKVMLDFAANYKHIFMEVFSGLVPETFDSEVRVMKDIAHDAEDEDMDDLPDLEDVTPPNVKNL